MGGKLTLDFFRFCAKISFNVRLGGGGGVISSSQIHPVHTGVYTEMATLVYRVF